MKQGTTSETMSRSVTWAYCPNCGHLYDIYCKRCIPTDTMGWEHRQAIMRVFRTALLCLLITGLAFTGLCYAEDKAVQEQVIQTETQGINREIQYLQSVQNALDERIIALKIGLRDLSAKLQALKTVEIDTTKVPAPPKDMGKKK